MSARKQRYLLIKLPLLNLAFALGYFLLAQFGGAWSSLTSNITLVWPAAGFSLFGVLLFGRRILPGLFLGALAAIQLLHLDHSIGRSMASIGAAALIASASILQIALIAQFNSGLFTNRLLISIHRAAYFIGSIIVGALISSTVGVVTLASIDVIPDAELFKSWAFWWMGESIGMLVFASLLARFLIARIRHNTYMQAFLLLSLGVGLVLFLVTALGYIESSQLHSLSLRAQAGAQSFFLPSWLQLTTLVIGMALVALLTAYLIERQKHDDFLQQNQLRLEQEVLLHTEALRKANDWLLNEVVRRQQIQEQLQASQITLRAREQHLRSLLDNIPDPVWFKNLEGVYISCNKAFAEMMGYSEADLLGKSENQLVADELAELFQKNDQQTLKNDGVYRYEQTIDIDAAHHYLLDIIKVALHDEQGNVAGILGIGRDIYAQKEAERQLSLAKETAEEATRAKSRFLANMSHEIRTPLNAVLGYTQLLMRDEQFSGSQRERLQLILVASQRLLNLINDVLDLSKIESGVLNLRKEYFDLQQEVADIQALMVERAETKGLQLITQVDLPCPFIVKGDRQKVGQILLNLLGNAIKFTPQGSVSLYVAHLPGEVEFVIGDTGPGISADELAELFAAFKQGQAGEESGGTGLGLTLSRLLAEGMGGSLQLSSVLGQGTLAHLRLPLVSENVLLDPRDHQSTVKRLAIGSQCRVLVVEDDAASCEILVDLLQQIGCDTYAAHNGREGLAMCHAHQFDIIFTDIRMPGMNGLEMFRQLRTRPNYQQTPIVAVSASSLEHERVYYLAQGFQEFIGKPYAFDDIFNALRHYTRVVFEGDSAGRSDESGLHYPAPATPPEPELGPIVPLLQQLQLAAGSGDMTSCKKIINALTLEDLGKQRHQQLHNALRQYDLERVEGLLQAWLM